MTLVGTSTAATACQTADFPFEQDLQSFNDFLLYRICFLGGITSSDTFVGDHCFFKIFNHILIQKSRKIKILAKFQLVLK